MIGTIEKNAKNWHTRYQWMPRICLRYAQDMPKICPNMPKICPRYTQNIPKICQRYAQDMSNICPLYAQDTPKIWPRYAKSKTLLSDWVSNMDTRDASASKNSDFTLEAKKGGLFPASSGNAMPTQLCSIVIIWAHQPKNASFFRAANGHRPKI